MDDAGALGVAKTSVVLSLISVTVITLVRPSGEEGITEVSKVDRSVGFGEELEDGSCEERIEDTEVDDSKAEVIEFEGVVTD